MHIQIFFFFSGFRDLSFLLLLLVASHAFELMNQVVHLKFGRFDELDASGLILDYEKSDVILILLPNKRGGLASLEAKLKSYDLGDLVDRMYSQEVTLSLPKFKIEFDLRGGPIKVSDSEKIVTKWFSRLFHSIHSQLAFNEEGAEAPETGKRFFRSDMWQSTSIVAWMTLTISWQSVKPRNKFRFWGCLFRLW